MGFRFQWDELTPLGIHFDGEFRGCPSGSAQASVHVHDDLGGGIVLDEAGMSEDELVLEALVDAPIVVHRARVDMLGVIDDPNCRCEIEQSIELEFELDFSVGNGWLRDASGVGNQVTCNCADLSATVPLLEFYFPRDILETLEKIEVWECRSNPSGGE
jgi:hypothetical protein